MNLIVKNTLSLCFLFIANLCDTITPVHWEVSFIIAQELSLLERMVSDLESLLVGDDLAVRIAHETNEALAHLRTHIKAGDDISFTGRPC